MPVVNFTSVFIRNVKSPKGKGKERYFDEQCKGLLLEVRESGTKTYFVKYQNRGKAKQMKLGRAQDLKVSQARELAHKYLGRVAMGHDPLENKKEIQDVPKFEDFAMQKYLPYVKGYKKSWHTDESFLRNHLIPKFGSKRLDEIILDEIISFHEDCLEAEYKLATANRFLVLMRFMYNLALKWETPGVKANPVSKFPIQRENNGRERYLKEQEVEELRKVLEESENPLLKYIVIFLLLTGARKREVLNAKWEDIDFDRNVWRIKITKSGKPRTVPLSQSAQKVLRQVPRIESCPYVFANPKTGKPFNSVYRSWNTARKKAGLGDVRMHDLRHSFASFLINSGRSIYEVSKLLGHSQITTTMRYAHLDNQTLAEAVNSVPLKDVA
ncbi:MAG: tyrosine-type recombinase/integrase [Bacteroidota bacterium]